MKDRTFQSIAILVVVLFHLFAGCASQQTLQSSDVSTAGVKVGQFDTGKMWTFDNPPVDFFARTYNFTPGPEWFEHARLSALRLPGCSASLVSADGLVMTNHHCAEGSVSKVTRDGENLMDNGFFARTREEERRIPDYYADLLVLIQDVTAEVQQAFGIGATDAERFENRKKAISAIEKRMKDSTGLTCSVVTLYNGGRYSLYGYKRHNDVRLVFAPENSVGYYGGDYDNFTYPRYNLDVAFYRIYDEGGNPLKTDHYFKWNAEGANEGEPVFVVGNPGRTSRLRTVAQLEFNRDLQYPHTLSVREKLVNIYTDFLERNPDKRIKLNPRMVGFTNARKVFAGQLAGLRDETLLARKRAFEKEFRLAVMNNPKIEAKYSGAWDEIAALQKKKAELFPETNTYIFKGAGRSAILGIAFDLVEYANQIELPEEKRLQKYKATDLEKSKKAIVPADYEPELDKEILAFQLGYMNSVLGDRDKAFIALLGARTPEQAASEIVASSSLVSKERVTALLNGSPDDILTSSDPLIQFVLGSEARAKEIRTLNEDINAREATQAQLVGRAMFDLYGTSIPPDATFSLRINDGVVKGFEYNGTIAPPITTFYGKYDRYFSFGGKAPWNLPERWKNPPANFRMSTPYNFSTTNDIIGGNSGSPVLNIKLEVVGIAFDGNMESLPGDFIYSDEKNRCLAVHSAGILEVLEKIYDAQSLANELRRGSIPVN